MAAEHEDDDEGGMERRRSPRISARIEVRFREISDAAKAFRVFSLNFSAGGLCLRPTKKYEVGDLLELSISVAGRDYNLKGIVAWERGGVIGVRFEGVTDEDRSSLEKVVASFERQAAE